jgi:hypothetical protein
VRRDRPDSAGDTFSGRARGRNVGRDGALRVRGSNHPSTCAGVWVPLSATSARPSSRSVTSSSTKGTLARRSPSPPHSARTRGRAWRPHASVVQARATVHRARRR